MHFRTEVAVNKSLLHLQHSTPFLTIGSCFAEEIGSLLSNYKFNVLNNPFGTTFNPFSIATLLKLVCNNQEQDLLLVQSNDVWLDYRFHSSLFGYTKEELHLKIRQHLHQARQQLAGPQPVCIITLGTAWVYKLKETDTVVANCHKQNSNLFTKELSTIEQLQSSMKEAFDSLFRTFSDCQVILTLSPVRHLKDGLEENQISKSLLRVLCHELSTAYEQVHYFPAYEIVLDDLRDYRFYEKDLLHPNRLAIEYIWEKFRYMFFDASTDKLVDRWKQIQSQLTHKAFYEKSQQHKKFLEQTLSDLEAISTSLSVDKEIAVLKNKIQEL